MIDDAFCERHCECMIVGILNNKIYKLFQTLYVFYDLIFEGTRQLLDIMLKIFLKSNERNEIFE